MVVVPQRLWLQQVRGDGCGSIVVEGHVAACRGGVMAAEGGHGTAHQK